MSCAAPSIALLGRVTDTGASALRDDDRQAVEACLSGDRGAFDRLVERHQREVYRLCFRYLGNHEDANDVAQDAFLRAYRALASFRGDSAFSTWLYRIAVNACLSFRRSRRPAEELDPALADPREGADHDVFRRERAAAVRGAIATLPDKQRATLILKVYHDLSHEEIARAMGSTVGTVKANLFHALAKLRQRLGRGDR